MPKNRTTLTWDFFIAHAGPDAVTAEALYDLMAGDSRVFLDSRCLELGDDWDTELAGAQQQALISVILVSSHSESAYYEREEIAAAIALARKAKQAHRVVPVYLDAEAASSDHTPYGLRLKHGLQLSDTVTLLDAAGELLALLGRLRSGVPGGASSSALAGRAGARDLDARGILHQPPAGWSSPVRRNPWRYKVAAFDFDGTLLRGEKFDFSWEAVWQGLAFGKEIQSQLKREYRLRSRSDPSRAIRVRAYQDWCDRACAHFKSRGLTRDTLRELSRRLRLTRNCREALGQLRAQGVVIAIISGGIDTFLEDAFPDFREYVDFVFINELVFVASGTLGGVRATPFDFEGKAEALEIVCEKVGCTAAEVVFVGDHFNDEAVMLRVHKAIAYPPKDATVQGVSHASIVEDDLMAVLPHVLVE